MTGTIARSTASFGSTCLPQRFPRLAKVLEQAADALVLVAPFDTLRRALSKHLKPNTFMTGDEAEAILLEAYEKYAAMQAAYRRSISGRRESPSLSTPVENWTGSTGATRPVFDRR
jgi:hypothetical protein